MRVQLKALRMRCDISSSSLRIAGRERTFRTCRALLSFVSRSESKSIYSSGTDVGTSKVSFGFKDFWGSNGTALGARLDLREVEGEEGGDVG